MSKRQNDIRIGGKFDYVEFDSEERIPVKVTNIIYDGFVFLIEFKHDDGKAGGCTQYPEKLKTRKAARK